MVAFLLGHESSLMNGGTYNVDGEGVCWIIVLQRHQETVRALSYQRYDSRCPTLAASLNLVGEQRIRMLSDERVGMLKRLRMLP